MENLEICGKELKNIIKNDDIILGLFVSIQKGCGKQLLSKLVKPAICGQIQLVITNTTEKIILFYRKFN